MVKMITIDDRHDAFGHVRLGGIGEVLARRVTTETQYEARAVCLSPAARRPAEPD